MIECISCGKLNNDGVNYCNYCGALLPLEAIPIIDIEMPVPTAIERIDSKAEAQIIQQINSQKKANRESNLFFLKIAGSVCGGMLLISLLINLINKRVGITMLVFAILGITCVFGFFIYRIVQQNNDITQRTNDLERRRGKIRTGNSILSFSDDEYKVHFSAMVQQLSGLGFTNIVPVNLGDLREGSNRCRKLNGYVSEVMAGDDNIDGNIWYDSNTMIIVKYHGIRP